MPTDVHRALFATLAALPVELITDYLTSAAERLAKLKGGRARDAQSGGD